MSASLRMSTVNSLLRLLRGGNLSFRIWVISSWKFRYSTSDGGTVIEKDVTLSENEDGTGYIMSGLEYDIELGYDEEAGKLTMVFQYVGMSGAKYVYVCADKRRNLFLDRGIWP